MCYHPAYPAHLRKVGALAYFSLWHDPDRRFGLRMSEQKATREMISEIVAERGIKRSEHGRHHATADPR